MIQKVHDELQVLILEFMKNPTQENKVAMEVKRQELNLLLKTGHKLLNSDKLLDENKKSCIQC